MEIKLRYSITVRGRVQGVSYRKYTQMEAQRLGVTGYVQNQPDSSVYVEAEGMRVQLDALVAWCHKGPALAAVSEVEVRTVEAVGDAGFEIRY